MESAQRLPLMRRIALFTRNFLEPTHYAIAQIISHCRMTTFDVYASRLLDTAPARMSGVKVAAECVFGSTSALDFRAYSLIHAIYDGDTVFEAAGAAKRNRLPLILSFHGGYDIHAKLRHPKYSQRGVLLANSAVIVTVVSDRDKRFLLSLGVQSRIVILPVPVDLAVLPARTCYGKRTIIAIGRLIEKKGIDTAIRALARMPSEWSMAVIGEGILDGALRDLSADLGVSSRVSFLGPLDLSSTLAELARSAVLVHPARSGSDGNSEGTPQAILWAQALGVPVVASRCGSIEELVQDRVTGRLVAPGQPDELAAAVLDLIEDGPLCETVLQTARRVVKQNHDIEKIAAQLELLYSQCDSIPVRRQQPSLHGLYWGGVPSESQPGLAGALVQALALIPDPVRSIEYAGEGGQGILFACFTHAPGPRYAIKLPVRPGSSKSETHISILREGRCLQVLMANLAPRLVALQSAGQFLVRHFVVGQTVQHYVKHLSTAHRICCFYAVRDYAKALFARLHGDSRGPYVLRDFKPANLVIHSLRPVAVIQVDFGSVNAVGTIKARRPAPHRAGSGQWLHWAPEELFDLGSNSRGTWSDWFSLGVTSYFILTGAWPFNNAENRLSDARRTYAQEYFDACRRLNEFLELSLLTEEDVAEVKRMLNPFSTTRASLG